MDKIELMVLRSLIEELEKKFEEEGHDINIDREGNDAIFGVKSIHRSKDANKKALFAELDELVSELDDCEKTVEIDNGEKIVKYLFKSDNNTI